MKKAKIMLLSVAVVAVVGGIFAFKAARIQRYCVSQVAAPAVGLVTLPAFCNLNVASTTQDGVNISYEFPTVGFDCVNIPQCKSVKLVHE